MTEHDLSDAELDTLLRASSPYDAREGDRRSPRPLLLGQQAAAGPGMRPGRTRRHRSLAWVAPTVAVTAVAVIAAGAVMIFGTGGPANTASSPDPTAVPTTTTLDPVSGQGPTEQFPGESFPIPAGSQSVVVDFECTGSGPFSVELGDSMLLGQAPMLGTCGESTRLSWPVTERTGSTIYVFVEAGVDWVATPTFSSAEFEFNDAIAADCEAFSAIYSALWNADQGFTFYKTVDASGWVARIDQAAVDLAAYTGKSQPGVTSEFEQLHSIITSPRRTVGAALSGAEAPISKINHTCSANQTPIIISDEFGG